MAESGEPPYDVGYAKPPSKTRFKPGQSGNPRGRLRVTRRCRPTRRGWRCCRRSDQALTQLNIGTLLGSVHYTRLGEYDSDYFTDPNIQRALARFQQALASIERNMESSGLAQTYPYLLPSLIPQSINI